MSKYQFAESDIYLPGTDIPKNHLGIETPELLHYELNGRITRLFFDLIAVNKGYEPIDYSQALAKGLSGLNIYIEASILRVQRADSSKLQQIVQQGLRRTGELD